MLVLAGATCEDPFAFRAPVGATKQLNPEGLRLNQALWSLGV